MILLLLLAGLAACEQVPLTAYSAADEETGTAGTQAATPQPQASMDVILLEYLQATKTAFFEISPQSEDCHIAIAGNPLDATIPDGTMLYPGEGFVKIWRIRNAGDCAWTSDYSIVWFSGDHLGTDDVVRFSSDVLPDEVVEFSVDMVAPQVAGNYQSNWKICDKDKNCFGLGSKGEYPFWAKIAVREVGTKTPTPLPTMTPTSVIFSSGRVQLVAGEDVDLDNGQESGDNIDDIVLGNSDSGLLIAAINGAEIAWFGQSIPSEAHCQNLLYVNDSISLQDMDTSEVLCYKSSLGYPGYIKFILLDLQNGRVNIEYTTWLAP